MAKTKVYGTTGLYEWQPVIRVGKAKYCPHFSGGTVDKNGTSPARYTTSNKIEQAVIENSSYFKNGRIYVLYEMGEDEQSSSEDIGDRPLSDDEMEKKEFTSMGDAANYLVENYGSIRSKLTSKKAIYEEARANGFIIVFTK